MGILQGLITSEEQGMEMSSGHVCSLTQTLDCQAPSTCAAALKGDYWVWGWWGWDRHLLHCPLLCSGMKKAAYFSRDRNEQDVVGNGAYFHFLPQIDCYS